MSNLNIMFIILGLCCGGLLAMVELSGCAGIKPGSPQGAPTADLPEFDRLWDYDQPGRTEQQFNQILPRAEASGNLDYTLQLLTQIARCQGLQQHFDQAHATLDGVEGRLQDGMTVARIRYCLERGRVFNSSGAKDRSKAYFIEAWNRAFSESRDFYAIDAAHMLGIVESGDAALAWNEKALALAERSTDKRAGGWRGSLYNNIGWYYFDQQNYEKAKEFFTRDIAWRQSIKDRDGWWIARWSRAKTLRLTGQTEEALTEQLKLLQERKTAGAEEDGYVSEEAGECLLALGRAAESGDYFKRAYELLKDDPWLVRDEAARLQRLKELGNVK